MVLKYYYDLMSQPSRALYIFLKLTNIPFESCPVALRNGEHLTDEFKENYNRFQKVPFIHEGDYKLSESVAILRYLTREYKEKIADHWYPKDSKAQAKVDEYLEWQHLNTRLYCASYFRKKWLEPLITGEQPNPKTVETVKNNMVNCINQIEELWLNQRPGFNYIAGGDKISFADILTACELEQPAMAGYDPREGHSKLSAWIEKVRAECNPFYDEAHALVYKIVANNKKRQAKL